MISLLKDFDADTEQNYFFVGIFPLPVKYVITFS